MNPRYAPGPRLYRDIDRRWVAGVLAGMASHFGWNLVALRLVALIATCSPLMPVMVLGYALAAMILPARTQLPPPPPESSVYGAAPPPASTVSAGELRYRIREMEDRLREMEAYVTSSKYEIDRELRRSK